MMKTKTKLKLKNKSKRKSHCSAQVTTHQLDNNIPEYYRICMHCNETDRLSEMMKYWLIFLFAIFGMSYCRAYVMSFCCRHFCTHIFVIVFVSSRKICHHHLQHFEENSRMLVVIVITMVKINLFCQRPFSFSSLSICQC